MFILSFVKKILKQIKPSFYHVQCWMWNYSLGKFVIENKGRSKVITEFYDVTGMYSDPEKLKKVFWEKIVDLDFYCEKFIFEKADGIIHRYKQDVFLEYAKKYKECSKILEFQQFPVNFEQEINSSKKRLVYCGNIIGPNDPRHPRKLFPTSGMNQAFEILISQGFEINVYLPIKTVTLEDSVDNKWLFELKKIPIIFLFAISLPIKRLIKEISKYDFGINLTVINRSESDMSNFTFDGGMGTKIHTFLEAGLPVLVNKEYGYMSEFLENNKIGFGLQSRDISKTKKLLKKLILITLNLMLKSFMNLIVCGKKEIILKTSIFHLLIEN